MRRSFEPHALLAAAIGLASASLSALAHGAPKQGDGLQTDSVSVQLVNRDFSTRTTSSIRDSVNLSGTVGLHYYFADGVRAGMGVQLTQRLWPEPPPGSSRLQRIAFKPQLGWNFCDPFFTALSFSYAPRTQGRAIPDLAVIGSLGAGLALTRRVKLSLAVEVPFAFLQHRTLGLVGLTGVSFLL
jgi:hypothetical protein